ncbi:MAG: c-type cytochrome [Planctomycetaceae bacterium]|nr:c-type cytochrome [Planctomycetaceae bacterium]
MRISERFRRRECVSLAYCTLAVALSVGGSGPVRAAEASQAVPAPRVTLGDASLTAGVPGTGPLSIAQLQSWLDDPKVHAVLEVELPLGLKAGTGNIKGLKENPLTLAKIELGRQLYFDRRLSADSSVSCADCHHPDEGWARATQFGVGIRGQQGNRNSPPSYNRILSDAQFWDGRAATLEAQAVGPIANPIEMGNTHAACVDSLKKMEGYRLQFERIFPTDGVTIDNVGRAIAAFERTIVTGPTPYDYYEPVRAIETAYKGDIETLKEDEPEEYKAYLAAKKLSDAHPMSESARRGRELFFGRANCTACHAGANFTDELYHNLGVGMDQPKPDQGRYAFTKVDADRGAFKTPTIRNVAQTAPYMHDGSQATLEEVVDWYDKGGHPNPYLSKRMVKLNLSAQDKKDLVEFMKALTGEFPKIETARLPE